ncbi:MAG: hypothetical protein Tsb0013_19180 [Phycisphaerales bacterium]
MASTPPSPSKRSHGQADAVTGVMLAQGVGVQEPKGFWADAWSQVMKQPVAVASIVWIAIVGALAVFAPLIASGHPLALTLIDADGSTRTVFPLFANLTTGDWLLLVWGLASVPFIALPMALERGTRLAMIVFSGLQMAFSTVLIAWIRGSFEERDASEWMRTFEQSDAFPFVVTMGVALVIGGLFLIVPTLRSFLARAGFVAGIVALVSAIGLATWERQPELFDYRDRVSAGQAKDPLYTLVPWSPAQQFGDRKADRLPPGASETSALSTSLTAGLDPTGALGDEGLAEILAQVDTLPLTADQRANLRASIDEGLITPDMLTVDAEDALRDHLRPLGFAFTLGTDGKGQDVLSQLIHASRLAISIGLVSTGIAVVIGVTLGALMGYFGGIVDMLLYRVVEVFMAVPVLFILIVAAGLLENPSTYVMMAIIGCFTWHSAARFVRAEFFKLRDQDFVQSAKAVGLPLRSILFKHMLPNGVTPVLVDASFAIALAIHFEATLSFLGLGPVDQASWGRLLADSTGDSGDFKWWLAVFPGGAIFLTALAYNLMGEALRDAIDPKLKKARV